MCRAGACGQLCFQGPDISSEASCGCGDHLSLADDESSCQGEGHIALCMSFTITSGDREGEGA